MGGEEYLENVLVIDLLGIERYLDRLRMASASGANVLVGGVWNGSARITRLDLLNAFEFTEKGLGAPEATTTKSRYFSFGA